MAPSIDDLRAHCCAPPPRRGYALLSVLLVLLALLVLSAPFLWTASHTDRTSARLESRAAAVLALDSATRHARHALGRSHGGFDVTRFQDSLEELSPRPETMAAAARDALRSAATGSAAAGGERELGAGEFGAEAHGGSSQGVQWSYEATDLSGRVDLDSASPQLLANLLGQATFLSAVLSQTDRELQSPGATGFRDQGLLWIDGELMLYGARDGGRFTKLLRGFLGDPQHCGRRDATSHSLGEPVLGYDALGIAHWRFARSLAPTLGLTVADVLAELAAHIPAALGQVDQATLEDPDLRLVSEDQVLSTLAAALEPHVTLFGGVAAGPRWTHPVRVSADAEGGPQSCTLAVASTRWCAPGSTVRVTQGTQVFHGLVIGSAASTVVLSEPVPFDLRGGEAELEVLVRRPVNVNSASPAVLRALYENLKLARRNHRITRSEAEELTVRTVQLRPFDGFEDFLDRLVLPAAGLLSYAELEPLLGSRSAEARETLVATVVERLAARAADLPPFLDVDDAEALVRNALNANDAALQFATAPFSFVSRDLYELDLRAAVHAASGDLRLADNRRQVEWIAPQTDLLRLWTFQEDFDEQLRQARAAPGWGTGPALTTVPDTQLGADPPPRAPAYFQRILINASGGNAGGTVGGLDEISTVRSSFPDRDLAGFAQPWHVRVDEDGPRAGRVVHFDLADTALEGHRPALEPWRRQTQGQGLLDGAQLLRAVALSAWVRPELDLAGQHLWDLAGDRPESDRIELLVDSAAEPPELVLRVLDAMGDHPETEFLERAEVRLAMGTGGVLPTDAWSHVEASVRGNRPDQMLLRVDGFSSARTPGLTRLRAALEADSTTIQVESTEGFPDVGPIRIGEEVIEVRRLDDQTFEARYADSGPGAGFGGRLAREVYDLDPTSQLPISLALSTKATDHPAGAPVSIYGYSVPLASNVPAGGGRLGAELGAFAVGYVTEVEGASSPEGDLLEATVPVIFLPEGTPGEIQLTFGRGWDSQDTEVSALRLAAADPGQSVEEVMSAFSPEGGFAAIVQFALTPDLVFAGDVDTDEEGPGTVITATQTPLGGLEIVRYSGVDGDLLQIADFDASDELTTLGAPVEALLGIEYGPRAFVVDWQLGAFGLGGALFSAEIQTSDPADPGSDDWNEWLPRRVFVVPISLPIQGSSQAFLGEAGTPSQFAQITVVGEERGRTEWLRYDEVVATGSAVQLVRTEPGALFDLYDLLSRWGLRGQMLLGFQAPGGGGGGGGGGQGIALPTPVAALTGLPPAAQQQDQSGPYWATTMGFGETAEANGARPLTRAVRDVLQFRGVLGTWSHDHEEDTEVLPVFRVFDARVPVAGAPSTAAGPAEPDESLQPAWGWPGADDAVFLVDEDPSDIGFVGTVHRAVRPPRRYLQGAWSAPVGTLLAVAEPDLVADHVGFDRRFTYLALRTALQGFAAPSAAFAEFDPSSGLLTDAELTALLQTPTDMRRISRLVHFPSGELPRLATTVALGQDVARAEEPAAIVVDEFFRRASESFTDEQVGGALVLLADVEEGDAALSIDLSRVRTAFGDVRVADAFAESALEADAGLLRIGDEVLCYIDVLESGSLVLAPEGAGRGLLGTTPQPHRAGESVVVLDHLSVGVLAAELTAEGSRIELSDAGGFGEQGTVLIGEELLHFTHRDGSLVMPTASTVPGARDGRGRGLFRGRFGTTPAVHPVGTPVIHFPARYWDRYAPRGDAPEQHFLGLELSQPDAWVRSVAIEHTDPQYSSARIGLLVRTDPRVPWDTEPGKDPGLTLHWLDRLAGRPAPIARQSGDVELRLFLEYQPGSFSTTGLSAHGWKEVPTIDQIAVDYLAPGRVYARSDR
jgi:hypothetical protein